MAHLLLYLFFLAFLFVILSLRMYGFSHTPLCIFLAAPFPEFVNYIDMDKDARLAHSCVARAQLIKTYTECTVEQQEMLVEGELCFR